MDYTQPQPVVTVRLKRSASKNPKKESWNLILEITNVILGGKYITKFESVHRAITTPIWDKSQKTNRGNYLPKQEMPTALFSASQRLTRKPVSMLTRCARCASMNTT